MSRSECDKDFVLPRAEAKLEQGELQKYSLAYRLDSTEYYYKLTNLKTRKVIRDE